MLPKLFAVAGKKTIKVPAGQPDSIGSLRRNRLLWPFALLLLLCTALSLPAETFRNPYRIATAVDPATMAVADFNGDGLPDIVWVDVSTTPSTLHVLLAQAGGSYLPGTNITFPIATTRTPECLTADFNQDGHQDLVCTGAYEFTNNVYVFLGLGDGTFQAPVVTSVPVQNNGSWAVPLLFSSGDLNGDGFPDLIEGQDSSGANQILLGDGKGSFKIGIQVQSAINNSTPYVGDVNGDGKPDLLLSGGPEVELGNGNGTFGQIANYSSTAYYDAACVFHDMEGNGHLDAVCGYPGTTGGNGLIILHGNPDGSFNTTPIVDKIFASSANQYGGYGTFLYPMAVYDANGDGIPDVLASAYDGASIILGGAGLSFAYPKHYAVGYMPFAGGYPNYQIRFVDMNGDGIPDVVCIGAHGIYISYGQKDGSLATAPAYEVNQYLSHVSVADFNGDGIPDVAAAGDAAIKLSLGVGDGSFGTPAALSTGTGGIDFSAGNILHGDFNGDGKQDLITVGTSGGAATTYLLLGHGDGTFNAPLPSSSAPAIANFTDASVVDINLDSRSDLLSTSITTQGASIISNLSNSDGSFTAVTTSVPDDPDSNSTGGYYGIPLPSLADFNNDGKLDAAYAGLSNVYVLQGHGDGSFNSTGISMPIPSVSGVSTSGSIATASGDFDGDGNADIAVLALYGSTGTAFYTYKSAVWVYYGDGHGNFSSPVLAGTFDRPYGTLAAVDLNRDGLADLVLNYTTIYGSLVDLAGGDTLGIVYAQPNRTFGSEINYTAGTSNLSPVIADLNKDGYPDILVPNNGGNSVTVLLDNRVSISGTLAATPEPSYPAEGFNITATLTPPTANTTITGTVSFSIDGASFGSAPLSGNTATLAGPATLAVGSHQLIATWPGDSNFLPLTLTGTHIVVAANPTATTLIATPNPGYQNQAITLTTTVAATTGTAAPAGSIALLDGTTPLGTLPVVPSASGVVSTAALSLSTLGVGTHTLTAIYTPNGPSFKASQSTTQLVILAQDFTLSTSAPSITIETGHQASLTLTVASIGGFIGPIQISCGSQQTESIACGLANSTLQLSANGTATTTLTLNTSSVQNSRLSVGPLSPWTLGRGVLAAVLPLAIFGVRRRRKLRPLLTVAVLGVLSLGLVACSGGGHSSQPLQNTPPGTYTIPLTASGTVQGSTTPVTHTTNLTLVVTP